MVYNDTSQLKKLLYVIFLGSFSVSAASHAQHEDHEVGRTNAAPIGTFQAPNSIAQLVLVSLVASIYLVWFLLLHPFEETKDGAPELFACIMDVLTYAGGLVLVVLANVTSPSSSSGPYAFLVISRVMLVFQAAGFAVFIATQTASVFWTVKHVMEGLKLRGIEKRVRDVKNCASYKQIVVKRFANRWLNRVLQRPLPGWPRLGPWTLEEQALVLALIEYYYHRTSGAEIDQKLIKGLPRSVGNSFIWSVVGEQEKTESRGLPGAYLVCVCVTSPALILRRFPPLSRLPCTAAHVQGVPAQGGRHDRQHFGIVRDRCEAAGISGKNFMAG